MKKSVFIIFIAVLSIRSAFCSSVDTTVAKLVAKNFYLSMAAVSHQESVRRLALKQIVLEFVHQEFEVAENENNSDPYYYVYNVQGNNGFIIVSADDNITPVLAYTFFGKYDVNASLPPAFIDWMDNYKKQIKQIKQDKTLKLNNIKAVWEMNLVKRSENINGKINNINPLLDKESIAWDQLCNYNTYCPYDNRSAEYCNHTPVGCVAVAMGQIMRFWKYPNISNSIPSYSDEDNKDEGGNIITNSNYGSINGVGSTTYNWTDILNKITIESTNLQKNAVSQLLYNCALSVKMNFGPTGSGANDIEAFNSFKNYFNYPSSIQYIKKNDYSNIDEWINALKTELNSNRPVYYRADDTSGKSGHAFVCDGYDSNNMFHFNWGWGGSANQTYCYIYSLIPDGSSYNFSNNQEAIIRIVPNKADLIPINPKLSTYTVQAGSTILAFCDESNSGPIAAGTHTLSIYLSTDNVLTEGENGDISLGNIDFSGVPANSCSLTFSKTIQIPSNTLTGNYYIIFKSDRNNTIDEFNEENNFAVSLLTVIPSDSHTTTDVDGNIYHTIRIGTQTWMVENLKVTHYRNGDVIPEVKDNTTWQTLSTGAWCNYNNDANNALKYGRLYNGYTVFDSRNLAPEGWHVPSVAEWTILVNYLIANGYNYDGTTIGDKTAKALADSSSWAAYSGIGAIGNDLTKNNRSGFSGLPGGYRIGGNGAFDQLGHYGILWSYTKYDTNNTWYRDLDYNGSKLYGYYDSNKGGNSIRCLMNDIVSAVQIDEISNSIKIYPNPTSESFHVSGLNCIATLRLTDISGKEIITKQISDNETVSISSLPKGLYFVKLISINGVTEKKLLKE